MEEKKIWIAGDRLVSDIQAIFNGLYPFLMIAFMPAKASKRQRNDVNTTAYLHMHELAEILLPCAIDFSGTRTVRELTGDFKKAFNIIVQVSRKSGNVWNIISLTDGWTLKEQNTAGEQISAIIAGKD